MELGAATRVHARLAWLRLRRGRLQRAAVALAALPPVAALPLALTGQWGTGFFAHMVDLYLRFLVPFVPTLLAASTVADEIESRTITYVFARPAPRSALVVGKYVAAVLPAAAAMAVSVALTWLCAMLRFPGDMPSAAGDLARAEAATVLGVLAFGAIALALGAVFTRHPFMAAAVWLLVIEAGLGATPIVLHLLAVSWHLRNVAGLDGGAGSGVLSLDVPAWASAAWATVVAPLGLAVAAAALANAEPAKAEG